MSDPTPRADRRAALGELARLFLRLGATAFGGPAAHVAMMEEQVVRRRRWLTREEFLDLLGATHLIPGPNSTELAIHVGHRRAGVPGLLVAGACFILPAAIIVTGLAAVYVRAGRLPAGEGLLAGVKPVVVAVVLHALLGFGRTAVKDATLAALGVAAAAAAVAGVNELAVLLAAGAASALLRRPRPTGDRTAAIVPPAWLPALAAASMVVPFTISRLFLVFLKIGSVLFGSGYVLLAFLRGDLVERLGWLTEAQLIDAVAIGQVTPGPVFTTATFVGYLLGGLPGAAVATAGIFLPAFVFVAASGPLVPRLRRSPMAGAVLDGVNVGSLALMAVVTAQLARTAITGPVPALLALASAALLVRGRVGSTWLVLAGAAVGVALGADGWGMRR